MIPISPLSCAYENWPCSLVDNHQSLLEWSSAVGLKPMVDVFQNPHLKDVIQQQSTDRIVSFHGCYPVPGSVVRGKSGLKTVEVAVGAQKATRLDQLAFESSCDALQSLFLSHGLMRL